MDFKAWINALLLFCLAVLPSENIKAHPLGDMLSYKDKLLWVYVCPIKSASHQACIMQMDAEGNISEWKKSVHAGSDWMLSKATKGELYLIERYYDHAKESHLGQLYKLGKDNQLETLIPWYQDHHRVGESGFAILDSGDLLFASRNKLYIRNTDGTKSPWPSGSNLSINNGQKIQRLRLLSNGNILIIQERDIAIFDQNGKEVRRWQNLIQPLEGPKPLLGNRIVDADFEAGNLYLAYWGNRRLELINQLGQRKVIKQYDVEGPWLPHATAYHNGRAYFLSSHLQGSTPREIYPELFSFNNQKLRLEWNN